MMSIPTERLFNWAGNLQYSSTDIFYPRSVDEIQQLVSRSSKVKALGSRHCFNDIADTSGTFISTKELNRPIVIDSDAMTVTVEGGMNYGQLCRYLHDQGYALHNLASLPHISIVGACATGTHGSGVKHGSLATSVRAIEFISGNGDIAKLSQADGEKFHGAVVNLGVLGVVSKVTLAIVPAYEMHQNVFQDLELQVLFNNFYSIVSAGYSVSLFTDWSGEFINEVWIKSVCDGTTKSFLPNFFGANPATMNVHPIRGMSPENCTEQLGVTGPWYERLPHFKMGFTPSSGVELQSEYFVPMDHAIDAIAAVDRIGSQINPHLLISEIRTICADNLWLSPCYQQDCVAIHFTWKQDWPSVSKILPKIESELAPYNVKPHWGKLFTLDPAVLTSRYERLDDFRKLAYEFDPKGKFRNEFLSWYVFA
jgi:alditol oxidase